MIEHFVRAGKVIGMQELGNHSKSEVLLKDYRDNPKFIYLDFVVKKLREYRLEAGYGYPDSVSATLADLYQSFRRNLSRSVLFGLHGPFAGQVSQVEREGKYNDQGKDEIEQRRF